MNFELDKKLEKDTRFVKDLELCQLRLVNNSDFPWVILVPKLKGIVEITDLTDSQYEQLNQEIMSISKLMQRVFVPDKLNIASIGNVVSQLHVHVIARFKDDKLFPKPVWGSDSTPYLDAELGKVLESLR